MRSLFVKILLWFILTVVVAVSGTFYVSGVLQRQQNQPQQVSRFSFTYELRDARDAWETEGAAGLESVLARVKDAAEQAELATKVASSELSRDSLIAAIKQTKRRASRGDGKQKGATARLDGNRQVTVRGDDPHYRIDLQPARTRLHVASIDLDATDTSGTVRTPLP